MKKIISLLLVVLTVFSLATVAMAADDAEVKKITVYFEYNLADRTPHMDTFEVPYGTDLDTVAPKVPNYDPDIPGKVAVFDYWTTTHPSYPGMLNDLPTINETDGASLDGIKFRAVPKFMDAEDAKKEENKDKIEDALGDMNINIPSFEGFGDIFETIKSLFEKWFSLFILYVTSFFG